MPPRTHLALLTTRALWTHVELAIDQVPHVPFHGIALPHPILQSVHTSRVTLSQMENPALAFIKLHMACPAFSFVEVS